MQLDGNSRCFCCEFIWESGSLYELLLQTQPFALLGAQACRLAKQNFLRNVVKAKYRSKEASVGSCAG